MTFTKLLVFFAMPLLIEIIALEQISVGIGLMILFAVYTLEGVGVELSLFSFKTR